MASLKRVGPDDPVLVDRQQRHPPAAPRQRLQGVEDRLVLDGAGDQVPAPGGLQRLGGAADGEVVAFGAAAGEHHLGRLTAQQRRDL